MEDFFKYAAIVGVTALIGFILGYFYNKRKKDNILLLSKNTGSNNIVVKNQELSIYNQFNSEEIIFGDINNPDIVINPYRNQ